jgi:hypothetical protein
LRCPLSLTKLPFEGPVTRPESGPLFIKLVGHDDRSAVGRSNRS